jgi:hypothetical protein
MSEPTFEYLPPETIGKKGTSVMPDGTVGHFIVVDEIKRQASNTPEKYLYLQKVKHLHNEDIELRFGYYILGKKPRMKGKWVWGQYAPFIQLKDFQAMIQEAQKRGWF